MPTTPASLPIESVVEGCKLNAYFRKLKKGNPWSVISEIIDPNWGSRYTRYFLWNKEIKVAFGEYDKIYMSTLNCCGITELNFTWLSNADIKVINTLTDDSFDQLVVTIIGHSRIPRDKRLLICGIPTSTGDRSIYNGTFYKRLLACLLRFGFKQTCPPYRNNNSGNTIVPVIGQL